MKNQGMFVDLIKIALSIFTTAKIMSSNCHICQLWVKCGKNNLQDPELASAQKLGLKLGFL
jgi:hypothetical protein